MLILSWITIVLSWILIGSASAYYAKMRGRNPYAWLLIGLAFGLIGLLYLFALPKREQATEPLLSPVSFAGSPKKPPEYWYYLDGTHQQQGPMSFLTFQKAIQERKISRTTLVWNEQLENWKSLQDIH